VSTKGGDHGSLPRANEHVGRATLRLLRAVVSERRLPTELWDTAVTAVKHAPNPAQGAAIAYAAWTNGACERAGRAPHDLVGIVTGKTTTVHASRLDYYDDDAIGVGADGRVRRRAAHEAFGFQVARLGGHRRAEDGLGWLAGSSGRYGAGSRTPKSRSSGASSATR
jgi:hypothetical protein